MSSWNIFLNGTEFVADLDGSLNEEDSSGGAGSGGEGNGQQQHVIVNEYLPASGETPVVANVPTSDDTNCSSFTYDYSLRVANGYKFAGTGNESSICRGYSYPSNGATSQVLFSSSCLPLFTEPNRSACRGVFREKRKLKHFSK